MRKKISVSRMKEMNNRKKPYEIFLDGNFYDYIENGEENKMIYVEDSIVEMFIKVDWCTSEVKKIDLSNKSEIRLSFKSSIPDYLWKIIVFGITTSVLAYFLTYYKMFLYISLLFISIPVFKITIGKNKYLIINEN